MTPEIRQSILERSGLRMRTAPAPPPFDNQFVRDLVAMRKAGLVEAVWVDADKIYIRNFGDAHDAPRQLLTRFQADKLIAAWKSQVRPASRSEKGLLRETKACA